MTKLRKCNIIIYVNAFLFDSNYPKS